jgi:metal-sulfur cluster biosynthetic enzyme
MKLTEEQVREALRPVCDPELGMSIVDLGLIRDVEISPDGRQVALTMTLTTPFCPEGPFIIAAAQEAVQHLPGVEDSHVDLVWSPPWDPRTDCSEDVLAELGIWD